jgi:SAM-dependent methyltransferase
MENLAKKRTHDIFYLDEKPLNSPKKTFEFIMNEMKENLDFQNNNLTLLDIGCATGEFIKYASTILSNINFEGIDIEEKLIDKARTNNTNSNFYINDIGSSNFSMQKKYNIITATGVLQILDDIDIFFKNIISLLDENGICLIFGLFNPEPVNVFITAKRTDIEFNHLETGWNLFSIDYISKHLTKLNLKYEWKEWNIDIPLQKNNDPFRSWTENKTEKGYVVVNGLQIIHRFYLLKIFT